MVPSLPLDLGLANLAKDVDSPVERQVHSFVLVELVQLLELGVGNNKICVLGQKDGAR